MSEIAVTRTGEGPEVLLVHGGASAAATWRGLAGLAAEWTLVTVHRRGYPPSPPGRHEFELDAGDLAPLLRSRPHVVAHSYGCLGALIATGERPGLVRSLTLIEAPMTQLVKGDPDVERLEDISGEVMIRGLEAEPAKLREFLVLAGSGDLADGPLPERVARTVRRAQGGRLTTEARPDLGAIRAAGVPAVVVSGRHCAAIETVCDALALELGCERLVLGGADHFLQNDPRFAPLLSERLRALG
jgi:pimeloyl-ACP methyl ester carboxylesterase